MNIEADPLLHAVEHERLKRHWTQHHLSRTAGLADTSYATVAAAGNCTVKTLRALLTAVDLEPFVRDVPGPVRVADPDDPEAVAEERLAERLAASGMPARQVAVAVAEARRRVRYLRGEAA